LNYSHLTPSPTRRSSDLNSNPRCARLIARISARDLLTVSRYSFSGTESATMPPPAWIYPLFPRTTSVRMAMQESRLLLKSAYIRSEEHTSELQSHLNLVC